MTHSPAVYCSPARLFSPGVGMLFMFEKLQVYQKVNLILFPETYKN